MHLLISYLSTNYRQLKKHWEKYSILENKGKHGSDRPFAKELGGIVVLLNWKSKKVEWQMDIESPSGLHQETSDLFFVNSIRMGKILGVSIKSGEFIKVIDNPFFNKPHSLTRTRNGFLVSSTGVDAIIEIDYRGNTMFSLFFHICGYPFDQLGNPRVLDFSANHQGIEYPSLCQTTHVNYARYLDIEETKIAATLFHTGELVVVDKKTSEIGMKLKNLGCPHNLKPMGEKYLLCDTTNNRVLVLDRNFTIVRLLGGEYVFSWVQDATWIPQSGSIIVADANNHRIVEMDGLGKIIDQHSYSSDYRIYEVCPFKS